MKDRGVWFVREFDTASELLDTIDPLADTWSFGDDARADQLGNARVWRGRADMRRVLAASTTRDVSWLAEHRPGADRATTSAACFVAKSDETLRAWGYVE